MLEYEMADDPRVTGNLYINADYVSCVVVDDVPDDLDFVEAPGS